jgi:hypothetical protein
LPKAAMDAVATAAANTAYETLIHGMPAADALKAGAFTGGILWLTDEFLNPVILYVERGIAMIPVINKFAIAAADIPRAVVASLLDVIVSRYLTKHNMFDYEGGILDLLYAAAHKFLIILGGEELARQLS